MLTIIKVKMKINRYNAYLFTVILAALILITSVRGQDNTIVFSPTLAQPQTPPAQPQTPPSQTPPNQQQQPAPGSVNNETVTSIVTLTDLNTGETQISPESSPQQASRLVQSELNTDPSLTPAEKTEASSLGQTLLAKSQEMVQELSETTTSEPTEQDKVVVMTEACTGSVCIKSITSKGDLISGDNIEQQYTAQGSSTFDNPPPPAPTQ
jgi:hypothetical protein